MKQSVLIADDDIDIVDLLTRRCRDLGVRVEAADNATAALARIADLMPNVVILDLDMPCGNGLSVCEMMATHEDLRQIPVILLTGSTSHDTIRRCHEVCAYYVLKCPDVWPRIEPILRELLDLPAAPRAVRAPQPEEHLPPEVDSPAERVAVPADGLGGVAGEGDPRAHRAEDVLDTVFSVLGVEANAQLLEIDPADAEVRSDRPWVLFVEDDDDVAMALKFRLSQYGVDAVRAAAGTEGYRRAFLDVPRAIILDFELPQGNGDYVLRRLKECPVTRDIPVIVLTGRREPHVERLMRSLGATEFLNKPFNWNQLRLALGCALDKLPTAAIR